MRIASFPVKVPRLKGPRRGDIFRIKPIERKVIYVPVRFFGSSVETLLGGRMAYPP